MHMAARPSGGSKCFIFCAVPAVHSAHCTVHNVHTAHCTVLTAHCTVLTAHCTVHTAHCTVHTAHCTVHNVHTALSTMSTLHCPHCTLHTIYNNYVCLSVPPLPDRMYMTGIRSASVVLFVVSEVSEVRLFVFFPFQVLCRFPFFSSPIIFSFTYFRILSFILLPTVLFLQ